MYSVNHFNKLLNNERKKEAKAGRLQVLGQPGLHSEVQGQARQDLSQNKQSN